MIEMKVVTKRGLKVLMVPAEEARRLRAINRRSHEKRKARNINARASYPC